MRHDTPATSPDHDPGESRLFVTYPVPHNSGNLDLQKVRSSLTGQALPAFQTPFRLKLWETPGQIPLAENMTEKVEAYRAIELARLDPLQSALWTPVIGGTARKAGNPRQAGVSTRANL